MTGADASKEDGDPISLYVHWPFCVSKCPYCDFNSHAAEPDAINHARWRDALVRELHTVAAPFASRALTSIFFGGGTPGLMEPETAHAVIAAAQKKFITPDDLEVTLEANPSSVEAGKFRAFRNAGVTRISVGVQALDDDALAFLGRAHDAATARKALEIAAETFDRFSFDMIYARPHQDTVAWSRELAQALAFGAAHMSLYQLTIEPGTPFFRDRVASAGEDLGADLYEMTQDIMEAADLPAYEISNHARPGEACRHNTAIWQGGDYLGVGPGAHGRLRGYGAPNELRGHSTAVNGEMIFTAHHRKSDPARWLAAVEQDGHGSAKTTPLSSRARAEELVMLGLRLTDGIDEEVFEARAGVTLGSVLSTEKMSWLLSDEFLERVDGNMRVTKKGRLNLNAVLAALLS